MLKSEDINWDVFNYVNRNKPGSFETMCRQLFIDRFTDGTVIQHVNPNTPGIEIEPILEIPRTDGRKRRRISFQSKYAADLNHAYKYFEESAKKTVKHWQGGLDVVYLFCNQPLNTTSRRYQKIINVFNKAGIEAIPVTDGELTDLIQSYTCIAERFFSMDTNERFLNINKVLSEFEESKGLIHRDDLKSSLDELIESKLTFIRGNHGVGKTTYLLQLIQREKNRGNNYRFKYYVWVPYNDNLRSSIINSLKESGLGLKDINNEKCLLLIDNAPKQVEAELTAKDEKKEDIYKFYSIVTTCFGIACSDGLFLKPNEKSGLDRGIFIKILEPAIDDLDNYIPTLVSFSKGHPLVANKLGVQAANYVNSGKSLAQFIVDLKKEGFSMNVGNEESVVSNLANRFSEDYRELSVAEQRILKCFSLLNTSTDKIDPVKIKWAHDSESFHKLRTLGFFDWDGDKCFGMHDLMRDVVRHLCGEIEYADVQDLVKALSKYTDRRSLKGADMISIIHEVYHAYSLFAHFSGEDYIDRQSLNIAEANPDYAWMTMNIFSAFDDYFDSRAYEGSKFAVRLCEEANKKSLLSDYCLAQAYICLAYLPSMFKSDMSKEETIRLAASNLEYLEKARNIYNKIKERGELYPEFEACLYSDLGGIWQRLYRLKPTNEAFSSYNQALNLRKSYYEMTADDDPSKEERLLNYARSIFTLATDCHFAERYDDAIRYHKESIAMYEKASTNNDYRLFVGYSRLAGTCKENAKRTKKKNDLQDAYTYFQKAYKYLDKQPKTVKDGADSFWKDFLRISVIISKCDLTVVKVEPSIDALVEKTASATDTDEMEIRKMINADKSISEIKYTD